MNHCGNAALVCLLAAPRVQLSVQWGQQEMWLHALRYPFKSQKLLGLSNVWGPYIILRSFVLNQFQRVTYRRTDTPPIDN